MKLVGALLRRFFVVLISCWISSACIAAEIRVAVASNFYPTAQQLVDVFEQESNHEVVLSAGSTGKHFAQIQHGAPFDLFLAADQERPSKLVEASIGDSSTLKPYAIGQLVLWQPGASSSEAILKNLSSGGGFIALANPKLAPYGRAAEQTLANLKLDGDIQARIVTGENVSQAYQYVATGNAKHGFVALAQILERPGLESENVWRIPSDKHDPIVQSLLLINDGEASRAFYDFMFSSAASEIIQSAGYLMP